LAFREFFPVEMVNIAAETFGKQDFFYVSKATTYSQCNAFLIQGGVGHLVAIQTQKDLDEA
jgi:hypothetical protein